MTKTLADLTPGQRKQCVGMWCDYPNQKGSVGLIYDIDYYGDPVVLRFNVHDEIFGFRPEDVTPRLDLPRAWEPDWSPVKGHWETSFDWGIIPQTRRYVTDPFDSYCLAVGHIDKHAVKGRKYQIVKEFTTEEKELPTIADTGWKEEYKGMWASVKGIETPFLMLQERGDAVWCWTTNKTLDLFSFMDLRPRTDLAPVNPTPHPAYLETLKDYQNAPAHTIVGGVMWEDGPGYAKYDWTPNCNWSSVWDGEYLPPGYLKGTRRKVLYWPEEGQ